MQVLALEPWLDGSHAEMLEAWQRASAHQVQILGLPGRHWKWRQSAGALTLAQRARDLPRPDVLWVSDFVDIPQLWAFLPESWGRVPTLLYLHENQLTYPRSDQDAFAQDLGPAWSNLVSLMAAGGIAFNSAFHRDSLRSASEDWMRRLPSPKPTQTLQGIWSGSTVIYPGIDWQGIPLGPGAPAGSPLRIAFPHRHEYDKRPDLFLQAVQAAIALGASIELVLLGEGCAPWPKDLMRFREALEPHVHHIGRLADREAYHAMLGSCDVVFSSAEHEFYGMAMLEACAAGCTPIAPNRLAYPEVLPTSREWLPLYSDPDQAAQRLLQAWLRVGELRQSTERAQNRRLVQAHERLATLAQMDSWIDSCVPS